MSLATNGQFTIALGLILLGGMAALVMPPGLVLVALAAVIALKSFDTF